MNYGFCNFGTINPINLSMCNVSREELLKRDITRLECNAAITEQNRALFSMLNRCNTVYCSNNDPMTIESFDKNVCEKPKPDIFEVINLLVFPEDPIRDWVKKEVNKINERFKPIETALNI